VTTKADFTEDEWRRLVRAPLVAGMAVSLADPGGPIEATKEVVASIRAMQSPPPDGELLRTVASEIHEQSQQRTNVLADFRIRSGPMAGEQVLEELREVGRILRSKADPDEAQAFGEWLLEAAQAAADAAKEGGFLGFGAERVSAGEQQMVERLRESFGADVPPRPDAGSAAAGGS
jgi:hypothetical protein